MRRERGMAEIDECERSRGHKRRNIQKKRRDELMRREGGRRREFGWDEEISCCWWLGFVCWVEIIPKDGEIMRVRGCVSGLGLLTMASSGAEKKQNGSRKGRVKRRNVQKKVYEIHPEELPEGFSENQVMRKDQYDELPEGLSEERFREDMERRNVLKKWRDELRRSEAKGQCREGFSEEEFWEDNQCLMIKSCRVGGRLPLYSNEVEREMRVSWNWMSLVNRVFSLFDKTRMLAIAVWWYGVSERLTILETQASNTMSNLRTRFWATMFGLWENMFKLGEAWLFPFRLWASSFLDTCGLLRLWEILNEEDPVAYHDREGEIQEMHEAIPQQLHEKEPQHATPKFELDIRSNETTEQLQKDIDGFKIAIAMSYFQKGLELANLGDYVGAIDAMVATLSYRQDDPDAREHLRHLSLLVAKEKKAKWQEMQLKPPHAAGQTPNLELQTEDAGGPHQTGVLGGKDFSILSGQSSKQKKLAGRHRHLPWVRWLERWIWPILSFLSGFAIPYLLMQNEIAKSGKEFLLGIAIAVGILSGISVLLIVYFLRGFVEKWRGHMAAVVICGTLKYISSSVTNYLQTKYLEKHLEEEDREASYFFGVACIDTLVSCTVSSILAESILELLPFLNVTVNVLMVFLHAKHFFKAAKIVFGCYLGFSFFTTVGILCNYFRMRRRLQRLEYC